ncbi:MAG: LamG domain-containing protein [Candidatus Paceibacterota bacterium]
MENKNNNNIFNLFWCLLFLTGLVLLPYTASASLSTSNTESLRKGLVGWWTFDANKMVNNIVDSSGNGNTGYLQLGTSGNRATSTAKVAGKIGQGLKLDGVDDSVKLANTINFSGGYTISSWVYEAGMSANGNSIINSWGGGAGGAGNAAWSFDVSSLDKIAIKHYNTTNGTITFTSSSTVVPRKKWQHLVAVYTGGSTGTNIYLYLNGILVNSGTMTAVPQTSTLPSYIGGSAGSGTFLIGFIDDLRIYNRALSATEIKKLYNMGGATKMNTSDTESLTKGLLGYWTFDANKINWGTGAAADSGGGGHNGQMTGIATTSRIIGKIGQALNFNGTNNYITVPQSPATSFQLHAKPYSISAWIKDDTPPASLLTFQRFVSWYDGTKNIQLGLGTDAGTTIRYLYVLEASASAAPQQITAGDLSYGWHHVTAVSDGANYKMYLDGALSAGGVGPVSAGVFTGNSTTLYIGRMGATGTGYIKGGLDDVRIYTRALSASEVKKLYNMGVATKIGVSTTETLNDGLVGYWTFDAKNMVNNVADSSGHGNTGYLQLGTLGNKATSTAKVAGKIGQAMKFDGVDDRILLSSDPINVATTTISMWIKANSYGGGNQGRLLTNSNTTGFYFRLASTNNRFNFSSNGGVNDASSAIGSGVLNKWLHVVVTRTAMGVANIYINGILNGTANQDSGTPTAASTSLFIGSNFGKTTSFNGFLDDVRVYNRVLSASEIKKLYNLGR